MASSRNSQCAACMFLERECTQECEFAPYFPSDQLSKFNKVQHYYGGPENLAKLLSEVRPEQRQNAVNSMAYDAEARLRDPVYGIGGRLMKLQQKSTQLRNKVIIAKVGLEILGSRRRN